MYNDKDAQMLTEAYEGVLKETVQSPADNARYDAMERDGYYSNAEREEPIINQPLPDEEDLADGSSKPDTTPEDWKEKYQQKFAELHEVDPSAIEITGERAKYYVKVIEYTVNGEPFEARYIVGKLESIKKGNKL